MPPPTLRAFRPFKQAFRASLSSAYFIFWLVIVAIFMLGCFIVNALLADEAVSYTKTFLGSPALERHLVDWLRTAIQYPIAVSIGLACLGIVGAAVFSAIRVERGGNIPTFPEETGQGSNPAEERPNLLCGECGSRQVTLGRNGHWIQANFPFDESVEHALVARFTNLADAHKRIGRANSLRARISYVPEDQDDDTLDLRPGFSVDPGAWLERRPPFPLNVGETAELLVALIADVVDRATGTVINKIRVVEDHGRKALDRNHRYTFGPLMSGPVVASVRLTANGMSAGRFKFLLQLGPPPKITPLKFPKRSFLSRLRNREKS